MAVPEALVGIVSDTDEDSLSIGILNLVRKTSHTETFRLKKMPFDALMVMNGNTLPPDLSAIKSFLDQYISTPETTRILMEVPPQPQPSDNKFFRVLFGLKLSKYIYFAMGVSEDKEQSMIHFALPATPPPATPPAEHARMKTRQMLSLKPRLGETYVHWLTGVTPSPEVAALGAALIGMNMALYHYLTSGASLIRAKTQQC